MTQPIFSSFKMGRNTSSGKLKLVPTLMKDPGFVSEPPPLVVDRSHLTPQFKMFYNDTIGNCTCAAVYNAMIAWQSLTDSGIAIPEILAVELYSAVTGYNPENPSTDQGAAEDDVLAYGVRTGYATRDYLYSPMWGTIDPGNINLMASAVAKFGVAYQGVVMRRGDMERLDSGQPLDTVSGMDMSIAGGHALLIWSYEGLRPNDRVQLITWGTLITATWEWVLARSIECHGLFFPQLMSPAHQKLIGLDLDSLRDQTKAFLSGNQMVSA